VSLGLLRLPYAMKALVQRRFPQTTIFSGEIVPAGGKMRYAKFLRADFYRPLWTRLTSQLPPEKIYLCMETREVWQKLGVTSRRDMIGGFPSGRIPQ
jgi:spore photoproduct lyase